MCAVVWDPTLPPYPYQRILESHESQLNSCIDKCVCTINSMKNKDVLLNRCRDISRRRKKEIVVYYVIKKKVENNCSF